MAKRGKEQDGLSVCGLWCTEPGPSNNIVALLRPASAAAMVLLGVMSPPVLQRFGSDEHSAHSHMPPDFVAAMMDHLVRLPGTPALVSCCLCAPSERGSVTLMRSLLPRRHPKNVPKVAEVCATWAAPRSMSIRTIFAPSPARV